MGYLDGSIDRRSAGLSKEGVVFTFSSAETLASVSTQFALTICGVFLLLSFTTRT